MNRDLRKRIVKMRFHACENDDELASAASDFCLLLDELGKKALVLAEELAKRLVKK